MEKRIRGRQLHNIISIDVNSFSKINWSLFILNQFIWLPISKIQLREAYNILKMIRTTISVKHKASTIGAKKN